MIFIVLLKFFDLICKVSFTWNSKPRPMDFHFDALPTELESRSSTNNFYMRIDIYL